MAASEKKGVGDLSVFYNNHGIGDNNQLAINLFSCGQGLDLSIINQYGQLMGEYSRLDDELWLAKPENDEEMAECNGGLNWNSSSCEHIVHPESLAKSVDNSVSDGGRSSVKKCSSSKDSSQSEAQTSSPVSVLQKRLYSSVTTRALKRARSKRRRHTKKNCSMGTTLPAKRNSQLLQSENYVESFLLDEIKESFQPERVRTRKLSDLLQLKTHERNRNNDPEIIPIQKLQMEAVKKCMHCDSMKTLKWREGPMGPTTLCNACGMQYKCVGLSPDNSSLKNPTCDSSLHSNLPKSQQTTMDNISEKIPNNREMDQNCALKAKSALEMTEKTSESLQFGSRGRNQELRPKPNPKRKLVTGAVQKCLHCESTETPQWRAGPMGRNTLCNACGVQYRKNRLFAKYRPLKSPTFDPYLHSNFSNIQQIRMDNISEKTPDNRKMDQSCAPQVKSVPDMTEKTSDLLEPRSREMYREPSPKSIDKEELLTGALKKCLHCKSTKTPQWRDGPMGRKTLCNACGVQYRKNGRLLPEYCPLNSPTFYPYLRSKFPKIRHRRKDNISEKTPDSIKMDQNSAPLEKSVPEMTEKTSDLLQSVSREMNEKLSPNPKPIPKGLLTRAVKKCLHCESTKTPQWREGPMGRNTLCNACGVQYRHGRLFPEYRPLKSPTYDPTLHSHLPKQVQQMRMRKAREKCANSNEAEQPA